MTRQTSRALTPRQARFVDEYLIDLNGTQAAIRAGYAERTASQTAYGLLGRPHVAAAVAEAMRGRSERTGITADAVLTELGRIAFARAHAIVRYRVGPCRHCWGTDHRYQFTRAEWERAEAAHEALRAKEAAAGRPDPGPLDPQGGTGFGRGKRVPNPACPECQGEGVGRTVLADTDSLEESERALYAGTRVTRTGVEIKLHDKLGALQLVGRHLGLFTERLQGGTAPKDVSDEPLSPEAWQERHAEDE